MQKKILIIDDQTSIRKMLIRQLKKAGYLALDAESGEKGIEILRAEKVDLVFLDQMMPEMDGLETLVKIKAQIRHSPPVIMVTAQDNRHTAVEAMKAGCIDFIPKPIVFKDLNSRIEQAMLAAEFKRELHERKVEDAQLKTALGMAATLQHEINNPLGIIILKAEEGKKKGCLECEDIYTQAYRIKMFLDDATKLNKVRLEPYGDCDDMVIVNGNM